MVKVMIFLPSDGVTCAGVDKGGSSGVDKTTAVSEVVVRDRSFPLNS